MLKANAIVFNNVKFNNFVLTEGALPKSSTRAKFSDMKQHRYNASRAAFIYVNAAETKHKGPAKGHTPSRVTSHNDHEINNKNILQNLTFPLNPCFGFLVIVESLFFVVCGMKVSSIFSCHSIIDRLFTNRLFFPIKI